VNNLHGRAISDAFSLDLRQELSARGNLDIRIYRHAFGPWVPRLKTTRALGPDSTGSEDGTLGTQTRPPAVLEDEADFPSQLYVEG
jgi:hypothetical protein